MLCALAERARLSPARRPRTYDTKKWRSSITPVDVRANCRTSRHDVLCGLHKLPVPQTEEVYMRTSRPGEWVLLAFDTICGFGVNKRTCTLPLILQSIFGCFRIVYGKLLNILSLLFVIRSPIVVHSSVKISCLRSSIKFIPELINQLNVVLIKQLRMFSLKHVWSKFICSYYSSGTKHYHQYTVSADLRQLSRNVS